MSIHILMDKPSVGLRHLCENCKKAMHIAGPGYERYRCAEIGRPITQMVTECNEHSAKDPAQNQVLIGQWKQQAFSIQRVNGVLEVLSPEEFSAWDHWTDNNTEPFDLEGHRQRGKERAQRKTTPQ